MKRVLLLAGPPLLAALVYWNALGNPFVYDDRAMVVGNPSLRDLANPVFVLVHQPFRPLVNLSYALDYAVWQLDPLGYHLTGLLLHAANSALLFRLVAGLPGGGAGVAAFAAALFAVHPMGTESVGYVSGRAEVLCATFFLGSLLGFRGAFAAPPGARRRLRLGAGLAGFALALACKEVAAALPAILVLSDLLFLPRADPGRRRRFLRLYLPMLAAVALGAGFRLHGYRAAEDPAPELALGPNLLTQTGVIWRYLGLFLLPLGQSLVHEVPEVRSLGDAGAPRAILAGAGLAAVAAASLLARALRALALPPARERALGWLAAAAILGAASLATVARNRVWSDPVALWADAARKAPRVFMPHYQLADALRRRGDCAAAVAEYRRAIELVPGHLDAHNHLGICLAETGRLAEARSAFQDVLSRDPSHPRARNNLRTLSALEAERGARQP